MRDRMIAMRSSRPRVLLLASEKALGEVILRGLTGMRSVDLEIDVTLSEVAARELVSERRYDLLVVGSENGLLDGGLLEALPRDLPAMAVGGEPNGDVLRVPLPLSYRLLERAVVASLLGNEDRGEEPIRRTDSVG